MLFNAATTVLKAEMKSGMSKLTNSKITVTNKTKNNTFTVLLPYNEEQINMLQKGGLLNTLK